MIMISFMKTKKKMKIFVKKMKFFIIKVGNLRYNPEKHVFISYLIVFEMDTNFPQ